MQYLRSSLSPASASSPTPASPRSPVYASDAALAPLLSVSGAGSTRKNALLMDPWAFALVLAGCLVPPLGAALYAQHLAPDARKKDDDAAAAEPGKSAAAAAAPAVADNPKAVFEWTLSSALEAMVNTVQHSLPSWLQWKAQDPWSLTFAHARAVLLTDKSYLASTHFLNAFRLCSYTLTLLLIYFLWEDHVEMSVKSLAWYSARWWILTCVSFAAVMSVHTKGLLPEYKKVHAERKKVLDAIPMRFVTLPTNPAPAGANAPRTPVAAPSALALADGNSCSNSVVLARSVALAISSPHELVVDCTALEALNAVDALAKHSKGALVERRLVWIGLCAIVRGAVGAYSASCGGSGWKTNALYGLFHALAGFLFYALAVQLEFEMHEDDRRWKLFSALHSAEKCRAEKMAFYLPLVQLGEGQNVPGWYTIRQFLKDLKGRFDHRRMEVMLACLVAQLASVCLANVYWSYVHLGYSATQVFETVVGDNLMIALDTFLCLSLILDMLLAAVVVNKTCGTHAALLLDEEMQRSFSLSGGGAAKEGHEGAVIDSIHQLAAVRQRLVHVKDSEKLTLFGLKADESIVSWVRTALISYLLVFAQSLFNKKVLASHSHVSELHPKQ